MHNVGKFHQIIADFYTHLSQKLSGNSWAARTWAIVLEFTIFTEFWQDISQILQYCQGFTIYRRGRKGRIKVQEIQEGQVRLSVDVMLRLGTRWWPPIRGSVFFEQLLWAGLDIFDYSFAKCKFRLFEEGVETVSAIFEVFFKENTTLNPASASFQQRNGYSNVLKQLKSML